MKRIFTWNLQKLLTFIKIKKKFAQKPYNETWQQSSVIDIVKIITYNGGAFDFSVSKTTFLIKIIRHYIIFVELS